MNHINYIVGQIVCVVITLNQKDPYPIAAKVTNVGRKWVSLKTIGRNTLYRVPVGSRDIDGGNYSSPGKVWVDELEYKRRKATEQAWLSLQNKIQYTKVPDHITVDDVNFAASRLGLS